MPARLAALALILLTSSAQAQDFAYLTRSGEALVSHHTLAYRFEAGDGWTVHDTTHRSARFNDVPFDISLSAFTRTDAAMMIHAEHVADLSGASNYDRFPETNWPVAGFRGEGRRCHDIPEDVVAGEHDLAWLRARGFEPSGPVWMEQHFLSGNDYNDEIVVSLIVRGESCEAGDRPDAVFDAMHQALAAHAITP